MDPVQRPAAAVVSRGSYQWRAACRCCCGSTAARPACHKRPILAQSLHTYTRHPTRDFLMPCPSRPYIYAYVYVDGPRRGVPSPGRAIRESRIKLRNQDRIASREVWRGTQARGTRTVTVSRCPVSATNFQVYVRRVKLGLELGDPRAVPRLPLTALGAPHLRTAVPRCGMHARVSNSHVQFESRESRHWTRSLRRTSQRRGLRMHLTWTAGV